MKNKSLSVQFVKYCFVGAISFVADFSSLTVLQVTIFKNIKSGLYIATALGFLIGMIINFILSKNHVFSSLDSRTNNNRIDFLLYLIIGIIGLLITEIGMFVGTKTLLINYKISKIFVAGIVLIWNFLARRFLIYKQGVDK
ncbi:MAG: GtrA family protein [Clostridia bacterium]|nr:GtrA family protein [Clostridia bacterium]